MEIGDALVIRVTGRAHKVGLSQKGVCGKLVFESLKHCFRPSGAP